MLNHLSWYWGIVDSRYYSFLMDHDDVKLSKILSWLLRHGAKDLGLEVLAGGYVDLNQILTLQQFKRYNVEDIERVVRLNDKKRFDLITRDGSNKLLIRANQGHSFKVDDEQLLEPLTSKNIPRSVIHGTYRRNLPSIEKAGISRMKRNHIHFATGEPDDLTVVSGVRSTSDVYIYIDVEAAMSDGIKFYRSKNGVILSPGNADGLLPTKYFKNIIYKDEEKINIDNPRIYKDNYERLQVEKKI